MLPAPEVNLGPDTSLCGSTTWVLDAGNASIEYLWSTGGTTQTIIIDTIDKGYGVQYIFVETIDSSGCAGYDEILVEFVNCTGIKEQNYFELGIYPNPNNGKFYVKTDNIENGYFELKIIDLTGLPVYQNNRIQVSKSGVSFVNTGKLKDGIYLVILTDNGNDFIQKMVVKN